MPYMVRNIILQAKFISKTKDAVIVTILKRDDQETYLHLSLPKQFQKCA